MHQKYRYDASGDPRGDMRSYDQEFALHESEMNVKNLRNWARGHKKFERNVVVCSEGQENMKNF